jgi:hypothetical protein
MKTSGVLSVTLLSPLLFGVSTPNGLHGQSDPVLWTRQSANYGVAEFGINSLVGDAITQSPSVFEPGYNGAFGFGAWPDAWWGFAQSFAVPSDGLLVSIELRLGRGQPAQGQFALSVVAFDQQTDTPGTLLGSILAEAADFDYELTHVPISSFDFSALNISLQATHTYAWILNPASTSWTGSLTVQSAVASTYPDGFAYSLYPVPEPATPFLLISGGALVMVNRRRAKSLT